MPEFRNLRQTAHQWGGTRATFFSYLHLSHDLCNGLLPALLPLVRDALGLSYFESGLLLSAFLITSGLSQIPGGWLGDRFSQRTVIAIGLTGIGLGALAVGLSSSFYTMLSIMVGMGIFSGAYHPSATTMLSNYFEESRRGKAIAIHMVGGSIGFALGPILGGLIADLLDWRFAFILPAIPTLIAVPLVLRKLRMQKRSNEPATHAPSRDNIPSGPAEKRLSIGRVLRPLAFIISLAVLTQLVAGSAMAFIPLYLVDKHNISPAYASILIGITRGGGIAGSLIGGWLSDRWGRKAAIILSLAATGPILYLFTELPFNALLVIVLILFGMIMYMRQVTVQPLVMDSTPPYLRATVFGIYFGLSMEGASLAQPLAGHYMDIFGIADVFHIIALLSIGVSVISLILVRRPKSGS